VFSKIIETELSLNAPWRQAAMSWEFTAGRRIAASFFEWNDFGGNFVDAVIAWVRLGSSIRKVR
jgi:hypothetical protein